MKKYTGTRMIKGETGDGQNDERNGGDGKEWRMVEDFFDFCHILYFHQVQFQLYRYSKHLRTSNLFPSQLRMSPLYPLIIIQVALFFYLLLPFSVLSHHLCFVHHFDHLLFLLWSFLFLCTSPSFYILCMWISFTCDSLVPCYILSFPSLTIACDIFYLHFTPISVVMTTLYMSDSVYKSQSLVLCSSVCN